MIVWILLGLAVLVVILAIYGYNRIVTLEMRARGAWANIDVQLRRVAELVPNLINTVKGSARFEKGTLQAIAEAHAKLVEAMRGGSVDQKVRAASNFMGVFVPIIYQIPQYPDLKTTEQFKKVLDELTVSMDKIAYARQFYNQAVSDYNQFIMQFPWVILARLLNKRPMPFFQAPEREQIEARLQTGELTRELQNM